MSTSISIKELKELDPSSYQIVDIRDAVEISHGAIPGALVMKTEEIETSDAIDRSKKTIICCSRGRFSVAAAEELQEKGWDAVSLEGGYIAWLMDVMSVPEEQDKAADVEKSLRKKFKKSIWSKFTKAINTYELVKPGDKIAVCISGGKDSMLMAKCFQELKLHNKFDFEVKFVVMDPGYSPENRKVIEDNAKSLHIPITIFETCPARRRRPALRDRYFRFGLPCRKFAVLSLRENAPRPSVSFCTAARLQQDCTRPSLR